MAGNNFDRAKDQFSNTLNSLTENEQLRFLKYVFNKFDNLSMELLQQKEATDKSLINDKILCDPVGTLRDIANRLKQKMPFDAILPSENISCPTKGENADALPEFTVHLDEFLYDDDEVEELVEDGKHQKHYCKDCGSRNIGDLICISMSLSKDALFYIFNARLPRLDGKTVLDIGSRLGAVLYGAYLFTDAEKIIGVEMNEEFCKLQEDIIDQFQMSDRINIVNKRIEDAKDLVESADVIVLNNPFEFFLSEQENIKIWGFLKSNIKKNTILITRPHLETTFKNLDTGIVLESWLQVYKNPEDSEEDKSSVSTTNSICDEDMFCDIQLYQVL